MGYEDAPSTRALATHCAMCSRPLRDAASVEAGIGPDCRKKFGVFGELPEETRMEANKLIHAIAVAQTVAEATPAIKRLRELGCDRAAAKLEKHWLGQGVEVSLVGGRFSLASPYSEHFTSVCRTISGRQWDGEAKRNTFPAAQAARLTAALIECYPERSVTLPDGSTATISEGFDLSPFAPAAPAAPVVPVKLTSDERSELVAVSAPYDNALLAAFRAIPGRAWDGASKLTIFPMAARAAVLGALREAFASMVLVEENGQVSRPSYGRRGPARRRYAY
jgi:hypothetical protein